MKITENVNAVILETSLGAVQCKINKVTGWDIDDVVSERTMDFGNKMQMFNLGNQADPVNNENTIFPTIYIGGS